MRERKRRDKGDKEGRGKERVKRKRRARKGWVRGPSGLNQP
jgi:hypothetical protein